MEFGDVDFYSNGECKGKGTLRVDDEAVFWGDVRLEYLQIVLHAICKDAESFPKPCLYIQYMKDGDFEEGEMEEIHFVPSQESILDSMFAQFSKGASLHLDPEDNEEDVNSKDDGDDDNNQIMTGHGQFDDPQ